MTSLLNSLGLICLLSLTLPCTSVECVPAPKLTISAPDWPPFYIRSPSVPGETGFATETLDICVRETNFVAAWEEYPIRRMFREMEQGRLDLNIMSFKKDRLQAVDYGKEVVFSNTYGLWTRTGISKQITSFSQLDNLAIVDLVGIRTSDEYRRYVDSRLAKLNGGNVLVVSTVDAIAKMLASHRADAAVVSVPEMRFRLKALGLTAKVINSGFTMKKQDYYVVVSKASPRYQAAPHLLNQIDTCVRGLRQNGRLEALRQRYGL